jgi:large subunit ribosomal protein L6
MVIGVSQGFEAALTITGVGYRAEVREVSTTRPNQKVLSLYVGFGHAVHVDIPATIESVSCPNPTTIVAKGAGLTELTQFMNKVRLIRPVSKDPYGKKGLAMRTAAPALRGAP